MDEMLESVISDLRKLSSVDHLAKLKRFGIEDKFALGIPIPKLRNYAKGIGIDHNLALVLWSTKIHEARILASYIADYKLLTEVQVENWVCDFDSWDLCDQCCNLIWKTKFVEKLIDLYSVRNEEFVKRTAFVLMCSIAVHDKKSSIGMFQKFLKIIEREAWDERNFVRKAVNWALRQIGKKSPELRELAIETAIKIQQQGSKSAKWIAMDALRELHNEKIMQRINSKKI